jgi:predicted enzyme related to lactoylglutathione lyase
MAKIESYAPGSFCWAELATSDADAAKQFYGDMFGWTTMDYPMPAGVYTMFRSGGNDVGAVYQAPEDVPTNWAVYFSVADIEASAAQIGALGGTIVMGPMQVGESGIMLVAQDPQGAYFSLWQAKQHIGASHAGPLGNIVWPELHTPDVAGAVQFYSGLFGWKTKPETGVETVEYVEWINAGSSMGGVMPLRADGEEGDRPYWMIYVTVANCDERTARAAELGADICGQPMDIPNTGRFAVITDTEGATFSIIQMMTGGHQTTEGHQFGKM